MKSSLGNRKVMGENIRRFLKMRDMTAADLSRTLGISYTTVADWVNGRTYPRIDKIEMMAKFFNVEKKDLVEDPDEISSGFLTAPIYSCLSCGTGTWIDEDPIDRVGIPFQMMFTGKPFANFAEGDSMEPGIHQGDLLIFQETPEVQSGQIGSFSLNGEYYCKRFKKLPDGSAWLFSDNPAYDPIPIKPDDDFRTLGLYKIKMSKEQ